MCSNVKFQMTSPIILLSSDILMLVDHVVKWVSQCLVA